MRVNQVLGAWVACGVFSAVVQAEIVRNPVNFGMALEEFQLFDANQYQGSKWDLPVTMWRPTGWIFESATIDDRVTLVFGLGATTFSLPRDSGTFPVSSSYQHELFPAVALVQASGSYAWGDVKNPMFKVAFGQMPYKYSPDARDFGEYLFRSTPYPNTVLNSPFDLVGAAQAGILGTVLSGNFSGGRWKNDLLVTSATSSFPLYDFSLAFITSFKFGKILELGAGINFFRLIPVQPEVTTFEGDAKNAYFTAANGRTYSTNSQYYTGSPVDSAISKEVYDSIALNLDNHRNNPLAVDVAMPAGVTDVNYYTLKGQILMSRFSIDLKPVLGDKIDLKLYGEWAMLGVKNYPVFYNKPVDRMPVTVGLNIPTMGLLDLLNVEAEYWKNPYLNSTFAMSYGGLGTPLIDQFDPNRGLYPTISQIGLASPAKALTSDDFKWSVSATRSLGKSFSVTAKAAKDHLQVMQQMQAGFPGKSYGDVMSGKKSWYYVVRLQLAI